MVRSMRPRPALAVLAAILAGFTLTASAIAIADAGTASRPEMPGFGCPPDC